MGRLIGWSSWPYATVGAAGRRGRRRWREASLAGCSWMRVRPGGGRCGRRRGRELDQGRRAGAIVGRGHCASPGCGWREGARATRRRQWPEVDARARSPGLNLRVCRGCSDRGRCDAELVEVDEHWVDRKIWHSLIRLRGRGQQWLPRREARQGRVVGNCVNGPPPRRDIDYILAHGTASRRVEQDHRHPECKGAGRRAEDLLSGSGHARRTCCTSRACIPVPTLCPAPYLWRETSSLG